MDVVVWLRSLGLGKYEAVFRENEINERVLPNLTAEDLKEIGVGPVGHGLEAIAALRADASAKPPSTDDGPPSSEASVSPEDRAERRQVTVMFSDLVGSTARRPAWTLKRRFVAKYMGDGVLVYFEFATGPGGRVT